MALLGPNGAGKTTLLLHLNGLLQGSGDVEVFGRGVIDADKAELARIRARVGLIFQDPRRPAFFQYGGRRCGVRADPHGARYERSTGEGRIGDGRRRPVGIRGPRAVSPERRREAQVCNRHGVLSMRPEIIVADEPSAGLDPRARRELIRLIESLPQTMLVATHDVDLARAVLPRCVIMNNGRVVADGATGELTGDQEFLESCGL